MNTKKDYEKAVKLIEELAPDVESRKPHAVAFAMFFERDNPRFDKVRFLAAAMGETTVRKR